MQENNPLLEMKPFRKVESISEGGRSLWRQDGLIIEGTWPEKYDAAVEIRLSP